MQILLRGGTLIDARGGEPLVNAGLLIEQGVILKIGAATDFAETPECPVVDCTGKTITSSDYPLPHPPSHRTKTQQPSQNKG